MDACYETRGNKNIDIAPLQLVIRTLYISVYSPSIEDNSKMPYSPYVVPLNPNPLQQNRRIRIVCIGAGFAGITIAYKVAHELKLEDTIDLQIYEKQVCLHYLKFTCFD